tara:strand:- start:2664 stop:3326 length:663 start_codon:yes stop_codon:yes gene_type:complete
MKKFILKTSVQYITMNSLQTQKERSDMILEPLQVMIQLGLLSFCPTGTKVSVSDNLLHLQQPSMVQGVIRWWQADNKDDLYYLFHAIRRYYKWYKPQNNKVYNHILTLAIKGITKLTETYSKTDKTSITHTLNLYKNVLGLENPDLFKNAEETSVNIDNVFEKITEVYDERLLRAVFNMFKLIQDEKNGENVQCYLEAMQNVLCPTNILLRKWIHDNLTC